MRRDGHPMLENKISTAQTVHSTTFPACLQMENAGKEKATLSSKPSRANGDHGYFLPLMSKQNQKIHKLVTMPDCY